MNKSKIVRPADLDNTKLHTREEYKAWQDAMHDYHAAVREEKEAEGRKAAAQLAESQRVLTDAEYHAIAIKRKAEQDSRDAAREAERQAVADAKAAYLSSTPAVAEITENSPYSFLMAVIHWAARGYSMPEQADITFIAPSYYAAKLKAPEAAPAKIAK